LVMRAQPLVVVFSAMIANYHSILWATSFSTYVLQVILEPLS